MPAATAPVDTTTDFAAKGEQDFKAANYDQAIQDWKHAMIDEPQQAGGLALMMGKRCSPKESSNQRPGLFKPA